MIAKQTEIGLNYSSDGDEHVPSVVCPGDISKHKVWMANHEFVPFFHWSHKQAFLITKQGERYDFEKSAVEKEFFTNPSHGLILVPSDTLYAGMITLSNMSDLTELGFHLVQLWEKTAKIIELTTSNQLDEKQHGLSQLRSGNTIVGKLSNYDCGSNVEFNTMMKAIGDWIKASSKYKTLFH